MGMYNQFETDKSLESEGVWVDYGDFRVKIAHAGGGNKTYLKYAEVKMKPLRRAIDTGSISRERSTALLSDIYAQAIVKGWQISTGDGEEDWKDGIEGPDGKTMKFNKENVMMTFKALPTLFTDIQTMAASIEQFRLALAEDEAKN